MLRIVDYAKRSGMEWYEVMRLCIDEETALQPLAILTHGELRVFELDDDEMIGDLPEQETIPLAYEECEMNPAFLARLIHAKFPVVFHPVTKNTEGYAADFYQLGDMPLRPPGLEKFEGMDRVWFGFDKEVRITLDEIWMPESPNDTLLKKPSHESHTERKPRKQITPHSIYIAHRIKHGKVMLNSWQYFKQLAAESRGTELVELPGYGPIYLKQDPKDIKGTVLWSETKFTFPTDGKPVKKSAFDKAWYRVQRQK
ncbi:MAG: hypothetical protein QGG48_09870 [Desulfatiglandales bacterium]|nr:hypothetical protein [Desulfatiglandales bacterium]